MPDGALQRCLKLATSLNAKHEWGLTDTTLCEYARKAARFVASNSAPTDMQLSAWLRYYHNDHALVEALLDSNHPEHMLRWGEWTRQALRILAAKTARTRLPDEVAASLEDLAQEAIQNLWCGLPSFSYQSSFTTWAFTIVGHCLARHYRAQQTQKRGALPPAQSLDSRLESGAAFDHDTTPAPDDEALSALLSELIDRALRQHPDGRIATIFHLWVTEEQTLRVIGDKLALSPARVHALLKQAIGLLQREEAIRQWVEQDMTKEVMT
jgi:RNA polymerase sigma factor (sigma-70 family)